MFVIYDDWWVGEMNAGELYYRYNVQMLGSFQLAFRMIVGQGIRLNRRIERDFVIHTLWNKFRWKIIRLHWWPANMLTIWYCAEFFKYCLQTSSIRSTINTSRNFTECCFYSVYTNHVIWNRTLYRLNELISYSLSFLIHQQLILMVKNYALSFHLFN